MGELVLGHGGRFLCGIHNFFVWDNMIFKTFVLREVKLSTPRGSLQMGGVKKEVGELTEVTCDKVSLTKNEYVVTTVSPYLL